MADINDLANSLFGVQDSSAITETSTIYGTAVSDSYSGKVKVIISEDATTSSTEKPSQWGDYTDTSWSSQLGYSWDTLNNGNGNIVELPTVPEVKNGDGVIVTLVGSPVLKTPYVSGVIGAGDRATDETNQKLVNVQVAIKNDYQNRVQSLQNALTLSVDTSNNKIANVQSNIEEFKKTADVTYSSKEEVDEKTGAITKTIEADYLSKKDANTTYTTKQEFKTTSDSLSDTITSHWSTYQNYVTSNDSSVADAKKAGTDAMTALESYKQTTDLHLTNIDAGLDEKVETWYLDGTPTASNAPANGWATTEVKKKHIGDVYYDKKTGNMYRWNGTSWDSITSSDLTAALGDIKTIKEDYVTSSELTNSVNEIKADVSDEYVKTTTFDNAIQKEQTDREAAISVQADRINNVVSNVTTLDTAVNDMQTTYSSNPYWDWDPFDFDDGDTTTEADKQANSTFASRTEFEQTADHIKSLAKGEASYKYSDGTEYKNVLSSTIVQDMTSVKTTISSIISGGDTYTDLDGNTDQTMQLGKDVSTAKTNASDALSKANTASNDASDAKEAAGNAQEIANEVATHFDETSEGLYIYKTGETSDNVRLFLNASGSYEIQRYVKNSWSSMCTISITSSNAVNIRPATAYSECSVTFEYDDIILSASNGAFLDSGRLYCLHRCYANASGTTDDVQLASFVFGFGNTAEISGTYTEPLKFGLLVCYITTEPTSTTGATIVPIDYQNKVDNNTSKTFYLDASYGTSTGLYLAGAACHLEDVDGTPTIIFDENTRGYIKNETDGATRFNATANKVRITSVYIIGM